MIFYSLGKRIKNFVKVKIFLGEKKLTSEAYETNSIDQDGAIKDGIINHFHENGNLKAECSYINYVLEGISNFYYENGVIKARENYKNGILQGVTKRYFENGKLKTEEYYLNGVLKNIKIFDKNGEMSQEINY